MTSTVTDLDTGRTRTGSSEAIMPEFLPFLAFEHLFTSVDVTIDRIGPGSAALDYTIRRTAAAVRRGSSRAPPVLVWNGKRYVAAGFARARRGKLVRLRVVVKPAHLQGTRNVDLSLRVPANATGTGSSCGFLLVR